MSVAVPIKPLLLDIRQLAEAVGESDSVIYEKVKLGKFPAPIKIGRKNKWRMATVEKYLERRDLKAGNGAWQ